VVQFNAMQTFSSMPLNWTSLMMWTQEKTMNNNDREAKLFDLTTPPH